MPITVTLQAASDANMTVDGTPGGTALADSDLRKVYGLPNQFIGYDDKLHFLQSLRWDTVNPPESAIRLDYTASPVAVEASSWHLDSSKNDTTWSLTKQRKPRTTEFQLRCDSITHDVNDMATIAPMPAYNNQDGTKSDSSTPGQLHNLVIAMGMRTEVIKLSGALVDEGPITASNPRKQVLMNIARMQYLKTGRGGKNSWGGVNSGPLNPNSYLCLTIYDADIGSLGTYDSIGYQPNGLDLVYRGLIKSLAFRQEGGRPNQWFWTMEFQALANEHVQQQFQSQGLLGGILEIERIRLVDTAGTPISGGDFPTTALVELKSSNDLQVQVGSNLYSTPQDYQIVMITSSNSTPKIDGRYIIYRINTTDNTFILYRVVADNTIVNNQHTGPSGFNEPDITQTWSSFTDGTKAYVSFGAEGGSQAVLVTSTFERPSAVWEFDVGDDPNDHTAAGSM